MLQDQFVSRIKLDAWLTVDAVCIQFSAQTAFRAATVTSGFARPTYFTL